jgi:hypothetical protein
LTFFHFDCASQLWQQIFWNTFYIRCAYFTPNCTWSLNYSVLVLFLNCSLMFSSGKPSWCCYPGERNLCPFDGNAEIYLSFSSAAAAAAAAAAFGVRSTESLDRRSARSPISAG